jgi:hypothetical protein
MKNDSKKILLLSIVVTAISYFVLREIHFEKTILLITLFALFEEFIKGFIYLLSTKISKAKNMFTRSFLIGSGFALAEVAIRYTQVYLIGKIPLFFLIIYSSNTFIILTMAHTLFSYIFIKGIKENKYYLLFTSIIFHTVHNLIAFGEYKKFIVFITIFYSFSLFYFYFLNHGLCQKNSRDLLRYS